MKPTRNQNPLCETLRACARHVGRKDQQIRRSFLTCCLLGLCLLPLTVMAQEADPAPAEKEEDMEDAGPLNMVFPTLGGKQLWADRLVYFDWRIQKNVMTGHYRLLDGKDRRRGWGTFEQCQNRLNKIRAERNLPVMRGKAVIVMHGLFRTRGSMSSIAEHLKKEGYTTLTFGYSSMREDVAQHAEHLASVMSHLEEIEEVNFVAHSLGNIVIRHYLADHTDPEQGLRPDPRIHRIVMLGPPNQHPRLASHLGVIDFTGQVSGPSAVQLGEGWPELEPHLCTPACDFGILAGGNGKPTGRNPLLEGDDDLIVSVASTRLPGAKDFRVLPVIHTTMMNDPTVQAYTLQFIRHGYFEDEAKRQPVVEVAALPAGP